MVSPLLSPQIIILIYDFFVKFTRRRIIFSLVGSIFFVLFVRLCKKKVGVLSLKVFIILIVIIMRASSKCNHKKKEEDYAFYVFSKIIKRVWKFFLIGLFIATLITF